MTVTKDAVISECGRYRYRLTRTWDPAVEAVTFVMLNPSTADAAVDDPTIRRCVGFAKAWGHGGVNVVNLYALRSTSPAGLWVVDDPVGPLNDQHLQEALERSSLVVVAWGANAEPDRVGRFNDIARAHRTAGPTKALRFTKSGAPGHPLYVPADARLLTYGVTA